MWGTDLDRALHDETMTCCSLVLLHSHEELVAVNLNMCPPAQRPVDHLDSPCHYFWKETFRFSGCLSSTTKQRAENTEATDVTTIAVSMRDIFPPVAERHTAIQLIRHRFTTCCSRWNPCWRSTRLADNMFMMSAGTRPRPQIERLIAAAQ